MALFKDNIQNAVRSSLTEVNTLREELKLKDLEIISLRNKIGSKEGSITILQSRIESLQEDIMSLSTSTRTDSEKAYFMDQHVVIVSDDGSHLYHKYDCSRLNMASFWIYNSEAAREEGYRPCNYCIN